jgi:Ras family
MDLEEQRLISTEEGQAVADELGCPLVETSAKLHQNIEKAYHSTCVHIARLRSLLRARQSAARSPVMRCRRLAHFTLFFLLLCKLRSFGAHCVGALLTGRCCRREASLGEAEQDKKSMLSPLICRAQQQQQQ